MFHLTVFNMNDKKWTTKSSHSTLEEAQKSFVSLAQDLDANCEIPSEINNFSSLVLEDKIIQLVYSEKEADKTDYSKIELRGLHNGAYVWPVHLDEEETETETETETQEDSESSFVLSRRTKNESINKERFNEKTNKTSFKRKKIYPRRSRRSNGVYSDSSLSSLKQKTYRKLSILFLTLCDCQ